MKRIALLLVFAVVVMATAKATDYAFDNQSGDWYYSLIEWDVIEGRTINTSNIISGICQFHANGSIHCANAKLDYLDASHYVNTTWLDVDNVTNRVSNSIGINRVMQWSGIKKAIDIKGGVSDGPLIDINMSGGGMFASNYGISIIGSAYTLSTNFAPIKFDIDTDQDITIVGIDGDVTHNFAGAVAATAMDFDVSSPSATSGTIYGITTTVTGSGSNTGSIAYEGRATGATDNIAFYAYDGDVKVRTGDVRILVGDVLLPTGNVTAIFGEYSHYLNTTWLNVSNITASGALPIGIHGSVNLLGNNILTTGTGSITKMEANGYVNASKFVNTGSTANNTYANAFGDRSIAEGTPSFAAGQQVAARGDYSTAFGYQSTASGANSFAVGDTSIASGADSVAMGLSSIANSSYASAFGYLSTAEGSGSFAGGYQALAQEDYDTAFGYQTKANGTYSFAVGDTSIARGTAAVAMGSNVMANGTYSIAIGDRNIADGTASLAMGCQSTANSIASVAIGFQPTSSGLASVAMGNQSVANDTFSTAIGYRAVADGPGSFSGGYQSRTTQSYATAFGYQTLGTGAGSTVIGYQSTANATYSSAFGYRAIAEGSGSFSGGYQSRAKGNYATAFGYRTTASASKSTAIGDSFTNPTTDSFAVGFSDQTFIVRDNNVTIYGILYPDSVSSTYGEFSHYLNTTWLNVSDITSKSPDTDITFTVEDSSALPADKTTTVMNINGSASSVQIGELYADDSIVMSSDALNGTGDFSNAADWVLGVDWAIVGEQIVYTDTGAGFGVVSLTSPFKLTADTTYAITYTIAANTLTRGAYIEISGGGRTTKRTTTGTWTENVRCTVTGITFTINAESDGVGQSVTMDDVIVKKVGDNAHIGYLYLDHLIAPTTTGVTDIGSAALKFKSLYLSGGISIAGAITTPSSITATSMNTPDLIITGDNAIEWRFWTFLGEDASIDFDGDSLNIIANATTATDDLEITADDVVINHNFVINNNGNLDVNGYVNTTWLNVSNITGKSPIGIHKNVNLLGNNLTANYADFKVPVIKLHNDGPIGSTDLNWHNITWNITDLDETTSGFNISGDNQSIRPMFDGIVRVQGCIHSKWNGVAAEAKVLVRVMLNETEARCTQASSYKSRVDGEIDSITFGGTINVTKMDQINVQWKVSDVNLDLEGDPDFDRPVAASVNFAKISDIENYL